LALLLLTAGCLLVLNPRRKTSIRIHRNIVFCVLAVQLLLLIVVLANTQLISMPFLCTFTTMALHYASVATYVWIAVESIHIYRMLSELRDINHGKTTFYSAAGFGIPGLVVGLTMGVSGNNYGSASFCWLSYSHSSIWGMIGPEVVCAVVHMVTMLLNLSTVFKVKTDLEDFATLRLVFFVNACLLPLATGFHVTALLMINDRGTIVIYTYAAMAVVLSIYLIGGFILCDKFIMRALAQCTGHSKKPVSMMDAMSPGGQASGHAGTNVAMATHHISRSSLSYGQRGKQYNHPNNLDAGAEVSVASTTSQSTYQTSSKFKSSHLDEPDHLIHDRYYQGNSDSETDIDRRSLDLASSINSSDEDMYDPSDLKHLSVNDYPQY
jgi:cadherin EGF LAG seven-pass G-type receptor 1